MVVIDGSRRTSSIEPKRWLIEKPSVLYNHKSVDFGSRLLDRNYLKPMNVRILGDSSAYSMALGADFVVRCARTATGSTYCSVAIVISGSARNAGAIVYERAKLNCTEIWISDKQRFTQGSVK